MLRFVFAWFLAFLVFTPARVECAPQHDHASDQPDRMGTVHFDTSCSPEVRDEFDLAVATLHSFGYRKSAQLFAARLEHRSQLQHGRVGHCDEPLPPIVESAD